MVKFSEIPFNKIRLALQVKKPWDSLIIFLLNVLIAVPVFIILHHNIIDPQWYYQIDRILLFILLLVIIQLILRLLRKVLIAAIFLYLLWLAYGSIFGSYGFNSV